MSDNHLKNIFPTNSIKNGFFDTKEKKLSEYELLLELGTMGQFPIFFPEWITESYQDMDTPVSLTRAKKKIKEVFERLSRHKSFNRKQTALISMESEERKLFIKSFLRVVENKILDRDLTQLQ
jgi:hypothetical protein